MRLYPALVVDSSSLDPDVLDLVLAIVDDDAPMAVDEQDGAWRLFFVSSEMRSRAAGRLATSGLPISVTPADVADEDWARRGQASLAPVRVGRLLILPSDEEPEDVGASGVRLVIPPSMGFGTGHHASTRLCLQLLQTIALAGARVLDLGTGSGILALASAKLGARRVVAVDIDEDALTAAAENVERNRVAELVSLQQLDLGGDAAPNGAPFDLVLANLTGAHLIRHAARITSFASPGSHLIASGFQNDEAADVHECLAQWRWLVVESDSEAEWSASHFRLRA